MKKTAFARIVVLVVVAAVMVTVLAGCKAKTATLNWGTDPTYAPFEYADANNKPTGFDVCLLYTSPSPRDGLLSRMPSSA